MIDSAGGQSERRGWMLPAVLSVLLLAVVATCAVLLHDRREASSVEPERPADIGAAGWTEQRSGRAVVAARTAASTYFTIDHRTVAADMEAMRALGTPAFVEEYDDLSASLRQRIESRRLVLTAELPRDGAATEYLVTGRAQVLVAVDVRTMSAAGTRLTTYRTRVSLDLVDGDWLVAGIDEVA